MILVDTSVWVDYLRFGADGLVELLDRGQVAMHPFVLGELAYGNLHRRAEVLSLLKGLPRATLARDDEVLFFIEHRKLMGRGIGYLDVHLLTSLTLDAGSCLWTRDKRLQQLAGELEQPWSFPLLVGLRQRRASRLSPKYTPIKRAMPA